MGVNFFSEMDAEDFGRFDRVFYGLFKILGGETWFEALDEVPPPHHHHHPVRASPGHAAHAHGPARAWRPRAALLALLRTSVAGAGTQQVCAGRCMGRWRGQVSRAAEGAGGGVRERAKGRTK